MLEKISIYFFKLRRKLFYFFKLNLVYDFLSNLIDSIKLFYFSQSHLRSSRYKLVKFLTLEPKMVDYSQRLYKYFFNIIYNLAIINNIEICILSNITILKVGNWNLVLDKFCAELSFAWFGIHVYCGIFNSLDFFSSYEFCDYSFRRIFGDLYPVN
jgi:hypothetical protein